MHQREVSAPMSGYEFDVDDAHELDHWVHQITSGTTESVAIRDGEEVVAVLRKPESAPEPPADWVVAGHSFNDDELPAPFDSIGCKSNNIGASVWVHLASGAMIAAVPTGPWKERAQFAFYYARPNATSAIRLKGWSNGQEMWDGSDADDYRTLHKQAIAYFNSAVGRMVAERPAIW